MNSPIENTLELTSAIYRHIERRVRALKEAGPFNSAKRNEYHQRAEEIRALYRHLRSLETAQVVFRLGPIDPVTKLPCA